MSTGVLRQSAADPESLLSDELYPRPTSARHGTPHQPEPPITMEESGSFSMLFGFDGAFVFDQEPDDWFMPILNQVCNLGQLSRDWNSYGARAIDPKTAALAVNVLLEVLSESDPFPSVVPTSRGGVLLEWHDGGVDLEVDVRSPWSLQVSYEDGTKVEEIEHAEISFIQEKISSLRSRLE